MTKKNLLFTTKYEDLVNYFNPEELYSFDVETNAETMFTEKYAWAGFSIGKSNTDGLYVCIESLDKCMSEEDKIKTYEFLKDILPRTHYLVHNAIHERSSIRSVLDIEVPYENIDDTMMAARLLLGGNSGAGLKWQAKYNLGYDEWESDKDLFLQFATPLVNLWLTSDRQFVGLDSSDANMLRDLLVSVGYDDPDEIIKLLYEKSMKFYDETWDGYEVSLLSYSLMPYKLISKYGAMDAVATYHLWNYYNLKMSVDSDPSIDLNLFKGYEVLKKQQYAGYILERNGMYWDEEYVQEVDKWITEMSKNCLKDIVNSPIMEEYRISEGYTKYLPEVLYENPNLGLIYGYEIVEYDYSTMSYKIKCNGKRCKKNDIYYYIPKTPKLLELCKNKFIENVNKFTTLEEYENVLGVKSADHGLLISNALKTYKDLIYGSILYEMNLNTLLNHKYNQEVVDKYSELLTKDELKVCADISDGYELLKSIKNSRYKGWYDDAKSILVNIAELLSKINNKVGIPDEYINDILSDLDYHYLDDARFFTVLQIAYAYKMDENDARIIKLATLLSSRSSFNLYTANRFYPNKGTPEFNKEFREFVELVKLRYGNIINSVTEYYTKNYYNVVNSDDYKRAMRKGKYYDPNKYIDQEKFINDMKMNFKSGAFSDAIIDGICTYINADKVTKGWLTYWVAVFSLVEFDFDDLDHQKNPYVKLLMDATTYIRNFKLMGSYINGDKIGRGYLVGICNKDDLQKGITTKRGERYYVRKNREGSYNLHENEGCLTYTKVGVCTAETLRWQIGLHTIPNDGITKKIFSSRYKGGTLFMPDYSQNEVRCIAGVSKCKSYLEAFIKGLDPHRRTASLIYQKPEEEINKLERNYSKCACVLGNTRVALLDGTNPEIKDLVGKEDIWLYSYDTESHKFVPGLMKNCRITKYVDKYAKVTFTDGTSIECTTDHKLLCRDGLYREVHNLHPGDSIMPFNTGLSKIGNSDYEVIIDEYNDKIFTHRMVTSNVDIDSVDDKCNFIHHKDFNKFNNSPTNLVWMSNADEEDRSRVLDNFNEWTDDRCHIQAEKARLNDQLSRETLNYHLKYIKTLLVNDKILEYDKYRPHHSITKWDNLESKFNCTINELVQSAWKYPGEVFSELIELGNSKSSESSKTLDKFLLNYDDHYAVDFRNRMSKCKVLEVISNKNPDENHEILSIEFIDAPNTPVYAPSVEKYENFCIPTKIDGRIKSGIVSGQTFAILYGSTIGGFARTGCNGDLSLSKRIMEGFYRGYPEIKDWINKMHELVQEKGWVPTITGCIINIPPNKYENKYTHRELRQSQNYPIQSASSCIAGAVLADICIYIENKHMLTKPELFIHDSLELDVPPDELLEMTMITPEFMNKIPLKEYGVPLKADLALGRSLGEELGCEILSTNSDDPTKVTSCVMKLTGVKEHLDATIDNWLCVYDIKFIEKFKIKDSDSDDEDDEYEIDEDGDQIKVSKASEDHISCFDVMMNNRRFSRYYGTTVYTGTYVIELSYNREKFEKLGYKWRW